MVAEVSSLFRFLNGYKEDQQNQQQQQQQIKKAEDPKIPITRDLLGASEEELDLDFQVPKGWEKRLDLKSGKVYLQRGRCNSIKSSWSSDPTPRQQRLVAQLQDLNFPPSLADEGSDPPPKKDAFFPSGDYQSVCTLDKVKSALEREGRESGKKRSLSGDPPPSSSVSSSSPSSIKGGGIGDRVEEKSPESTGTSRVFAAACPSCLTYVLLSRTNPKCPSCDGVVPFQPIKKPKILDLNV